MTIIQNEYTIGIKEVCVLNDNKVAVGQQNGVVSIWNYSGPNQLECIRQHEGESSLIRKLVPYLEDKFISINKKSEIKIWETNTGRCKFVLQGRPFYCIDQAVMLPNSLLVVSGYSSPDYACFDVWDLETKKCIYQEKEYCHLPGYMLLQTTLEGLLVVAKTHSRELSVWEIGRTVCKLLDTARTEIGISLMAVLPTGEIVIASSTLYLYKISQNGKISLYKTFQEIKYNEIDTIYPFAGNIILIAGRCGIYPSRIKLLITVLNYITNEREFLDFSSVVKEIPNKRIVLEKEGAVLTFYKNSIEIHEFPEKFFAS